MYKLVREIQTIGYTDRIEVVELEQLGVISLSGWNGEVYNHCYRSDENGIPVDEEEFILRPVQEPLDEEESQCGTIGYEM